MDSSPQGFRNWMMTEAFGVEGSVLIRVANDFFELCELNSWVDLGDVEADAELLERFLEVTEQLRAATLLLLRPKAQG